MFSQLTNEFVVSNIVEVSVNNSVVKSANEDDWATEWAIIASNVPELSSVGMNSLSETK